MVSDSWRLGLKSQCQQGLAFQGGEESLFQASLLAFNRSGASWLAAGVLLTMCSLVFPLYTMLCLISEFPFLLVPSVDQA